MNRNYYSDFLQMCFYYSGTSQILNCFVELCNEVLAYTSLKPTLLRKHLETRHTAHTDKNVECFKRKWAANKNSVCLSGINENRHFTIFSGVINSIK